MEGALRKVLATFIPALIDEVMDETTDEQLLLDVVNTTDITHTVAIAAMSIIPVFQPKEETAKIEGFVEETMPMYSLDDFRSHFRMSRNTFDEFLHVFRHQEALSLKSHTGMSAEGKLCLTIWTLANQESYRQIADRFGISRGYAHFIFTQCCSIIRHIASAVDVITWPNALAIEQLSQRNTFPGAFGAVDGCHIPIKTPLEHTDSYINRKSVASVVLQAVCTHDLQFIDVSTAWPGSMHDARIYRRSQLSDMLNSDTVGSEFHILGDSAYPLEVRLMVPFRDNGHLSPVQKTFNYMLSASRCSIERAFGLLKGKFRRLKYLDINNIAFAADIIITACTLHNYILQHGGDDDDMSIDDSVQDYLFSASDCTAVTDKVASRKRNEIAAQL